MDATAAFDEESYGAPPTGRAMAVTGMAKSIVGDGMVQEDRPYYDQEEMLARLGLTFPDVLFLPPKMTAAELRGCGDVGDPDRTSCAFRMEPG